MTLEQFPNTLSKQTSGRKSPTKFELGGPGQLTRENGERVGRNHDCFVHNHGRDSHSTLGMYSTAQAGPSSGATYPDRECQ